MHLKCTACDTSFYSASTTKAGSACTLPGCTGTLALPDEKKRLVSVRSS